MNYLLAFLLSFLLALMLTPLMKRVAFKVGAIDSPGEDRKIHKKPIARLGGVAIYLAFVATILLHLPVSRPLIGLLAGATILVIVGIIDDIKGLSPWVKLAWQVLAAGVALSGGIGIITLTNPLGGLVDLSWGRFAVDFGPLDFHITPIANLFSILWMVGLVNATNFLDGLDGLVGGVSVIAALVIFFLAVDPNVMQPESALIAIALAGAALGFLPYNFYPARIFMGDSGSYFLGLTLAMLAIYSGAKLATAALVMGFTIIDAMWTVLRRLIKRTSPFKADRHHLHHLLLDAGLTQRQAVLILYLVASFFGLVALNSGSFAKLMALIAVTALTMIMTVVLVRLSAKRSRK